ncbi:predicted protein [Thalassiosira pseudonana CCMP1335]|uniref:Rubisco accumulation factor 1 C-terminal domain-containing protein n=1 Tax=Thalassiosira pseudonana TaxID=35128 RepID=B8BVP4_THAPS|nr:predicted protein [Thalassiosira pseudonana CCMP1335]EED94973.1 predicted protein [Thalassiosira pseudonana CCMP1335]
MSPRTRKFLAVAITATTSTLTSPCHAFATPAFTTSRRAVLDKTSRASPATASTTRLNEKTGNLHGESSCFLPLLQNDDEYIAPRVVQIAGAYPGVTAEEFLAVTSEPPAELGQWAYDFTDPNGPQMGTVALPGMTSVYETDDPVVIIAEHPTLGVTLHEKVVDPVDLVVLCDRSKRTFAERKFFVFDDGNKGGELTIGAFTSKDEIPESVTILGQVTFVQIPWLPMMQKKKSGFSEDDDLF